MIKKFVVNIILFLILGQSSYASSMLEIPDNKMDFGYVPQNSTVKHSYWFYSTGDDTLKIKEIKTGCSCTLMPLERDWIAPGDSMKVAVTWEIKKKLGSTGKYPYIYTNAQEDPFRVALDAKVFSDPQSVSKNFSILPYKLELSKIGKKIIDSVEFKISSTFNLDVQILIIDSQIDECNVEIPKILPANSTITGTVKVKDEYKDKEFNGSITIELTGEEKTRISLPIRRKDYNLSSK